MLFERVPESFSKDFGILLSGDFVAKSRTGRALLRKLDSFLADSENELALFHYFAENFGVPKDTSLDGGFASVYWDFVIDKNFFFDVDYCEGGFEAMFDCDNSSYRMREEFLEWFLKQLDANVKPLLEKPREELLTAPVKNCLERTKGIPRVRVLGAIDFPQCFFCGFEFHVRLISAVIVNLQQGRKEEFLKMKLNKITCPNCGFSTVFFPEGFTYMDENGLKATLHKSRSVCRETSKILNKRQEKIAEELRRAGDEVEFDGFSVHETRPFLIVEAVKKFDEYCALLKKEAKDGSLQNNVEHNYKKFYYNYILGNLPKATAFLENAIDCHAKQSNLPPASSVFFREISKKSEKGLTSSEKKSLELRLLFGLLKNQRIGKRISKLFPNVCNSARAYLTFGLDPQACS